jgi:hypothetical protein
MGRIIRVRVLNAARDAVPDTGRAAGPSDRRAH